jgi:hypothetical protein
MGSGSRRTLTPYRGYSIRGAIQPDAERADLPVDEVVKVADTVVVRADPAAL